MLGEVLTAIVTPFDANGAGSMNLTGLSGGGAQKPYDGLVVWKADNSTVSCNGFLTNSAAGVCFEGSFFAGANFQGVIYAPL